MRPLGFVLATCFLAACSVKVQTPADNGKPQPQSKGNTGIASVMFTGAAERERDYQNGTNTQVMCLLNKNKTQYIVMASEPITGPTDRQMTAKDGVFLQIDASLVKDGLPTVIDAVESRRNLYPSLQPSVVLQEKIGADHFFAPEFSDNLHCDSSGIAYNGKRLVGTVDCEGLKNSGGETVTFNMRFSCVLAELP